MKRTPLARKTPLRARSPLRRTSRPKMTPARKSAKGMPCYLRLPGVCCHDPDTTVLCHRRVYGVAGGGQKPPDTCSFPGCVTCHAVYDGRVKSDFDRDFLEAEADRAQNQWLAELDRQGYQLVKIEHGVSE